MSTNHNNQYSASHGGLVPMPKEYSEHWKDSLQVTDSHYSFISASLESTAYPEWRAIYVGNGGDLGVTGSNGVMVKFSNVQNGTILPIRAIAWNGGANSIIFLY